jgi:hypothetical protein
MLAILQYDPQTVESWRAMLRVSAGFSINKLVKEVPSSISYPC